MSSTAITSPALLSALQPPPLYAAPFYSSYHLSSNPYLPPHVPAHPMHPGVAYAPSSMPAISSQLPIGQTGMHCHKPQPYPAMSTNVQALASSLSSARVGGVVVVVAAGTADTAGGRGVWGALCVCFGKRPRDR